jgi:flagellar basal body-associated protein FliL
MAEEAIVELEPQPDSQEPAPAKGSGGKLLPMAVVGGAIALGLTLGSLVIAPQMTSGPKDGASSGHADAGSEPQGAKKKAHKPKKGGHGSYFEVESIVVNPSGAQGRFLMATVVFETAVSKDDGLLRDHEHLVTDVVIGILGSRTMESLAEPGARDSLKTQIARTVEDLVGTEGELTIYLPQFVVQ